MTPRTCLALGALAALSLAALAARGQGASPAAPDTRPSKADIAALAPMVKITGATFAMGSASEGAEPNESPVHRVTVHTFEIDLTEVTVGAYKACVQRGVCRKPKLSSRQCTFSRGEPWAPMNCVSFDEADTFCLAYGKRLPTEAEWELAARGSTPRAWPWGDSLPTCAHAVTLKGEYSAERCSKSAPLAVGPRAQGQSPSGVLDMAGNVEEWTADYYADRYDARDEGTVDPKGPPTGFAHVLRGGGWLSPRNASRTTARSWGSSEERGANVGFRCAR